MDSMTIDGTIVSITTNSTVFDASGVLITADAETIANIYSNIPTSAPLPGNPQQYSSTHIAGSLLE